MADLAYQDVPQPDPYDSVTLVTLQPVNMDVETVIEYWKTGAALLPPTFQPRDVRLNQQSDWSEGRFTAVSNEQFIVRDNLTESLIEEVVHSTMATPPSVQGLEQSDDEEFIAEYHEATRQVIRSKLIHGAGVYVIGAIGIDEEDEDELDYAVQSMPVVYYKPLNSGGYVLAEPYTDYSDPEATSTAHNRLRLTIFQDEFDGAGIETYSIYELTGGSQIGRLLMTVEYETVARAVFSPVGDTYGYFGKSLVERLLPSQLELNRLLSQRSHMQHEHANPRLIMKGPAAGIKDLVNTFATQSGQNQATAADAARARFSRDVAVLPDGWDANYLTWDQNVGGMNSSIEDIRRQMREIAGLQSVNAQPRVGTASATGLEILQGSAQQTTQTLIRETRLQLLEAMRNLAVLEGQNEDAVTVEWLNAFDVTSAEEDNVEMTEQAEAEEDNAT